MGGRRSRWSCSRSSRRRTATCGRSLDSSYAWVRGPYSDADDSTETTEIAGQRAGSFPAAAQARGVPTCGTRPRPPRPAGARLAKQRGSGYARTKRPATGARFASRFSDG